MQRYPQYTRGRIDQRAERFGARIHDDTRALDAVEVSGPTERIPYEASQESRVGRTGT